MSTRYFKDANGLKMVIDDPLCMQHCLPIGFVECDANWQPLKPVVREWVRGNERWRWDGEKMTYTEGTYNPRVTMEVPKQLENARSCLEVHPGTRTPIDQPLPSSEPPAKAVREFVHHTDFRFAGDKCEASVNNGPWRPVNDTIEDMAAIGAKEVEVEREPAKPEPTHKPKEQQDTSRCLTDSNDRPVKSQPPSASSGPSVAYLDGKLNAVADAVSRLSSRVSQIEMSQDASGREWNFWRKGIEAELKRSGDETAKAFRDLAKVVNRVREIDHKIDTHWQFREIREMASKFNERLDAIESNARRTDAVVNKSSGKMVAKSEPIHIQVASLIAVNQKLEAELGIVRKERDELQVRCNDMHRRANDYRLCCERMKAELATLLAPTDSHP